MYRPLSPNETLVVSRTLYDERGLNEGFAMSLFMAYKAKAMHDDVPEFEVFTESEKQRLAFNSIKAENPKGPTLSPMDFLNALDDKLKSSANTEYAPHNAYEWYFGDDFRLDAKHKRLRVLFHNSSRYRKQVLRYYTDLGVVKNVDDMPHLKLVLGEFTRKYPGTRQGIISHYEIFFGDPSGFSYEQTMERESFLTQKKARDEYLQSHSLPLEWDMAEIKCHLQDRAIESGVLTQEVIDSWNVTSEQQ